MIILGIDPGSIICGYGVIESESGKISLIEYGVIKAKKKEENFPLRLKEIFERLQSVIDRTLPDETAIESPFYSKNAQTLIKLSQARAVAMLASTLKQIPIIEYSPKEIKKAVTGNGNAGKVQVQYMVKKMLNIHETNEFYDSTDALATAICHTSRRNVSNSTIKSWKDFIESNPQKIFRS
ncbi:MAG TPA: crossover junction endodeoxyribonuclease RuvC [Candidatus Kapabacteria bacterium]|nr:crossover junction endodeoxyribonuclease RuvC [Candidatus Kapabacteria bacterium]